MMKFLSRPSQWEGSQITSAFDGQRGLNQTCMGGVL